MEREKQKKNIDLKVNLSIVTLNASGLNKYLKYRDQIG